MKTFLKSNILLPAMLSLLMTILLHAVMLANPASPKPKTDPDLWQKVDSLMNLGQPRSALEVVETIYSAAKQAGDEPEVIKAVIYQVKLTAEFGEDALKKSIDRIQKEIALAQSPARQIFQSILAELYWRYYQDNLYRFRDRTRMASASGDSLESWDEERLSQTILKNYLLSVTPADSLKSVPIARYSKILVTEVFGEKKKEEEVEKAARFKPTLYDFLAGRALEFLTSGETRRSVAAGQFHPDQEWHLAPTSAFIRNRMLIPQDSSAPASFALSLFRDLATFHFSDKDRAALTDIELKRLDFVLREGTIAAKDSLYVNTLKVFEKEEVRSPWSTSISYTLASYLRSQGQKYQPLISSDYKFLIRDAARICDTAIQRFPESEGASDCRILKNEIMARELSITTESAVPFGKPALARISSKNIKELHFRLIRIEPEMYAGKSASLQGNEMVNYLSGLKAERSWLIIVPNDGDLQPHALEMELPAMEKGFYILFASSSPDFSGKEAAFSHSSIWFTGISSIINQQQDGSMAAYLLDRVSGLPLKGARAEVWVRSYDYREKRYNDARLHALTADDQGFLTVPPANPGNRNFNMYLKIFSKDDRFYTENFFHYPKFKAPEQSYLQTMFYTDRSIYRPGQTIYYKAVVMERNGENTRIKPGHATRIFFNDVNGQQISTQTLTTNEFGSVNGSFVIPTDRLPGMMTLSGESGYTSVSVEYYKRPTFEIIFKKPEGNYRLNEPLAMKGKAEAYTGSAITDALVTYRVVRTARFPWYDRFVYNNYWPMPVSPETEITSGATRTDAQGGFSITFNAQADLTIDKEFQPVFDFLVYADVTDLNGETQSSVQEVSAGYTSLLISADIPETLDLTKDSLLKITTTNLNGSPTPSKVSLTLCHLRLPDRPFKPRLWQRPDRNTITRDEFYSKFPYDVYGEDDNPAKWAVADTLLNLSLDTKDDTLLRLLPESTSSSDVKQRLTGYLRPGVYRIHLRSHDPYGQPVESEKSFTVFSPASAEMPVNQFGWSKLLTKKVMPGEKARFMIGTKDDNVRVLYEVMWRDSLVSREWLRISDRVMVVEIPVTEKLRGAFAINLIFVKQNRPFQFMHTVEVPWPDRKLEIRLETFRDKLLPGARESWKVRIEGPGKKPARAEFLVAMYDASLDAFRPHQWEFNIAGNFFGTSPWQTNTSFETSQGVVKLPAMPALNYQSHPELQLNWFGFNYSGGNRMYRSMRKGGQVMEMDMAEMTTMEAVAPPKQQAETARFTAPVVAEEEKPRPSASGAMQIRRDFRETAFFYPSLVTDSTGMLSLEFTMPESLTKWRLLGLAHTKTPEYGLIEKELVTTKELMVFPNAPRFVRQGDTILFSARVVNLGETAIEGEATIELSDAVTSSSFRSILADDNTTTPAARRFSIGKGQSGMVSWSLVIPYTNDLSVLKYRITARAGNFSDGEEKAIPVLTNRMLVTETLPLPVRGAGSFSFTFDKLLKSGSTGEKGTLKNRRLVLEFSTNPAWYAIQALPSLNEPRYESADAVFNAWWSNSLAAHIANANPGIRAVFESWKNLTPDALKSNLAKNEELKTSLLQETPWVMEAISETERKQKLGEFFDHNRVEESIRRNFDKLARMQSPAGGWGWMEGMPDNRYITQNIFNGMAKLIRMGALDPSKDPGIAVMINRAMIFLAEEINRDFSEAKKYDPDYQKNNHLSATQVQFLYGMGLISVVNSQSTVVNSQLAIDYYLSQAEKFWLKQDLYTQGMIAVALHRLNRPETPAKIIRSLSEKSLRSQEMGMYWAYPQGYYWYQAPIETQAMMIEAFDEVAGDRKSVEEMKVWLLKQKQTQSWPSPRATLEACHALLMRGSSLLDPADGSNRITITLGSKKIDPSRLTDVTKEAGTGYFQLSWSGSEIDPSMGKVVVEKKGDGVAWGALYWQYFEDLDKITPAKTPLKVEKKLFVERNTAEGPVLEAASGKSLQPGSTLVSRIVLSVDRNMEFVHLKDMRASILEPSATPEMPSARYGGSSLSGYRFSDGLGYYQSVTDAAVNFFFDHLPKGSYVFEYRMKVNAAGNCSNGITTVQCHYAPEFSAQSEGVRIGAHNPD